MPDKEVGSPVFGRAFFCQPRRRQSGNRPIIAVREFARANVGVQMQLEKYLPGQGGMRPLLSQNYLLLMISLVAVLVAWPMLGALSPWAGVPEGLLFVTLGLCVLIASSRPGELWLTAALGVIALVIRAGAGAVEDWGPHSSMMYGVFFGFAAILMLLHIFKYSDKADVNLIYGAVCIYLLVGLSFAFFYTGLVQMDAQAFSGVNYSHEGRDVFVQMVYFSFITISTLGYGDILPVSDLVRPLAYAVAVQGQLYLTVLVVRLVGMHLSESFRS
jgi:hypothetical protein